MQHVSGSAGLGTMKHVAGSTDLEVVETASECVALSAEHVTACNAGVIDTRCMVAGTHVPENVTEGQGKHVTRFSSATSDRKLWRTRDLLGLLQLK